MSRAGYANRQVVILMIQACPPPRPACFGADKTWRDWLIQAHLSGLRVVRVVEIGAAQGCRTTQRRLLPTAQIAFCNGCTDGYQRAMKAAGRCVPSNVSSEKTPVNKEPEMTDDTNDIRSELEQTKAALADAIAERDTAERALAQALAESEQQQQGALLYLAAVVGRAVAHGTTLTMSRADMEEAMSLVLERGDTPDGGLALRVYKEMPPVEPSLILPLAPVLAKAKRTIILLDTSRPQGE